MYLATDEEEEDLVVVDGDILVTKEQAAIYYESGWDGLVNSQLWYPDASIRWKKRVPYYIANALSKSNDEKIKSVLQNLKTSLAEIPKKTCLTFDGNNCGDYNYIKFTTGDK